MKLVLAVAVLALLFAIPAYADTISYSLSAHNYEPIGDFSWTVVSDGFILLPPLPIYDDSNYDETGIFTCIANCDPNPGYFSPIQSSAPSMGEDCTISRVFIEPNLSPGTWFTPLCDGLYDAAFGGGIPEPGITGSWTWLGDNTDGTQASTTLTITDLPGPVSTPEPRTWGLLLSGLAFVWVARKVKF
jgi:hypothetical protein